MTLNVPFKKNEHLSASSIQVLVDWISANGIEKACLGGDYLVCNLIDDLHSMIDGMWSDGIDAMGDDT